MKHEASLVVEAEVNRLLAIEPRVEWPDQPAAADIKQSDVRMMRTIVALGLLAIAAFLFWFFSEDRIGSPWLYWSLTAVLMVKLTMTVHEWICYLGVRPQAAAPPSPPRSVDVLTTWCPGEPREMVVATLKSIQRMRLPHTTYLCDEGDDPVLKRICAVLGVRHVTRTDKKGAKAGNINNALRQATGDIAVVLDPDHEMSPYFLERVLGYFDDKDVGFVQSAQGYYNQNESLIARAAAEQTYLFYGPIMTGMSHYGVTQAIGANCAFRRVALDSIGGHATGLAEDMATTLELYGRQWKSIYVPEILTRGLAPASYGAYAKQQIKWACGVWDIFIERCWRVFGRISWANRIQFFFAGLFYLRSLCVLVGAAIPIAALTLGLVPWKITFTEFIQWYGPVFFLQILIRQVAQRWVIEPSEFGFHALGGFLVTATWWVHLTGIVCSVLRIKIPYIPTPKEVEPTDAWLISLPNILFALASLLAVFYGLALGLVSLCRFNGQFCHHELHDSWFRDRDLTAENHGQSERHRGSTHRIRIV